VAAREGHISESLAIPKVKQPKRIIPTYSADDVVRILSHKPRNHTERRLLSVLALLVDSGLRIEEALILRRAAIDLDSLVITVKGKGQKDRIVPFSIECRKSCSSGFSLTVTTPYFPRAMADNCGTTI
jgi:site-specific recombinase XerD